MTYNKHGLFYENTSVVQLIQRILDPCISVFILYVISIVYGVDISTHYGVLLITIFLSFLPIFKIVGLYRSYRTLSPIKIALKLLLGWALLLSNLLFLGYVTRTSELFSRSVLLTWSISIPVMLAVFHLTVWKVLRTLRAKGRNQRSAVIGGVNDVSCNLASQLQQYPEFGIKLHG
ncbi:MAG: undecaprenyl-phosphate glucose phosphotransferase, partial [Thermosynechococcaceae cyanobacterium]